MNRISTWLFTGCLMFLPFISGCATLQESESNGSDSPFTSEPPPDTFFELVDGDRVVFLGNSLFEHDLKHGYIEYALTTRFPDRDVTFRNLGWSGDTVFGESRGYFTTPPDAYGHLMDQLSNTEPTLVFIAYGTIESLEGEEGISRFEQGLNQLLDKIEELEAEAILLSPIPHYTAGSPVADVRTYNERLERYAGIISETAANRGKHYIDLFQPLYNLGQDISLTDNGIHLNETGYYYLASEIEKALGFAPRNGLVEIRLSEGTVTDSSVEAGVTRETDLTGQSSGAVSESTPDFGAETGFRIAVSQSAEGVSEFTVHADILPMPTDELSVSRYDSAVDQDDSAGSQNVTRERSSLPYKIVIRGLTDGIYSLSLDDHTLASATASEWSEGVAISHEVLLKQAAELREWIVQKNDLYFQQYRPQNRTYLTGFRSYEQGQNAVELDLLDEFILKLEEQISGIRQPEPMKFQLTRSD